DFPSQDSKLFTEKGLAFCQKVDIFKGMLWFSYKDDPANWHPLTKEQVREILEMNRNKEKVSSLEAYAADNSVEVKEHVFENVVGQDSLTRFDRPKQKKNRNRNKNKKSNRPNDGKSGRPNNKRKGPSNKKPAKNA